MIKKLIAWLFPPQPKYEVQVQVYGEYAGNRVWVIVQRFGPYAAQTDAEMKAFRLRMQPDHLGSQIRVKVVEASNEGTEA